VIQQEDIKKANKAQVRQNSATGEQKQKVSKLAAQHQA
jgi:hypothetical protein